MSRVDKLIVTNQAALIAKYGAAGHAAVQAALNAMIVSDGARGLATRILYIDDAAEMATVGGSKVAGNADERGAKAAVDAAFASLTPDYLMLFDGPDVVPHIALNAIPGLADGDTTIPSDLPYASSGAWSRDASRYLAVTRVVGRLPAAEGCADTAPILAAIAAAGAQAARPTTDFDPPFALSAQVWQNSTQTSVNAIYGPGRTVEMSPPAAHPAIDPQLPRLAHFINCHGASGSAEFYGQQGTAYPTAMESARVAPHIAAGTVAAAECCFGAQLFDFTALGTAPPICMAYMQAGATAFVGSTTIAYGPAAGNGQADLLTQYFLSHVLAGASIGRAMLQARQDFIRTQAMSSPANLKTVAQFLLFGDPACTPCQAAAPAAHGQAPLVMAEVGDAKVARKAMRVALDSAGKAAAGSATRLGRASTVPQALTDQMMKLGAARGFATQVLTVIEVTGGAYYRSAVKSLEEKQKIGTMVDRRTPVGDRRVPFIRVLTAHILDDRIIRVEETESR